MLKRKRGRGNAKRVASEEARYALWPYAQEFLLWSASRALSERTLEDRRQALRRFAAWCDERGVTRIEELNLPLCERYQRQLFHYRKENGEPLSWSSQATLLSHLRAFGTWLARSRHLAYNPAAELELPRRGLTLPRHILSVEEIAAVFAAIDVTTAQGVRDRAMVETLYSTGMRRLELVRLKLTDWNAHEGVVLIRQGKGQRDRVVPIGERASAWLARYRDEVRPLLASGADDGTLFLTDYGEAFEKNRLGHRVKGYLAQAGITAPGSCHLFRHACATHMLANGADIRMIQVLLGHADISTTQVYTHVSITQLQAVHAATHPARLTRPGAAQSAAHHLNPHPSSAIAPATFLAALAAESDDEA